MRAAKHLHGLTRQSGIAGIPDDGLIGVRHDVDARIDVNPVGRLDVDVAEQIDQGQFGNVDVVAVIFVVADRRAIDVVRGRLVVDVVRERFVAQAERTGIVLHDRIIPQRYAPARPGTGFIHVHAEQIPGAVPRELSRADGDLADEHPRFGPVATGVFQANDFIALDAAAVTPDQIDPAVHDAAPLAGHRQKPTVGVAHAGLGRVAVETNVAPAAVRGRLVAPRRPRLAQVDQRRKVRQLGFRRIRPPAHADLIAADRATRMEVAASRIVEPRIRAERIPVLREALDPLRQRGKLYAVD